MSLIGCSRIVFKVRIYILSSRTISFSDVMKRVLKNMTGRDKIGLGREILEVSCPWGMKNLKPMANPGTKWYYSRSYYANFELLPS